MKKVLVAVVMIGCMLASCSSKGSDYEKDPNAPKDVRVYKIDSARVQIVTFTLEGQRYCITSTGYVDGGVTMIPISTKPVTNKKKKEDAK